ncbi:MAG: GNAT family N-acetyltransferase [Ruminiclostridium sp.]
MIRKAVADDIEQITAIYNAIHTEEESGRMTIGWSRGIYPTRKTALDASERGELFVETHNNRIVAAGILNQNQLPEYYECHWKYPADDKDVMVLHTLVVDPAESKKGYAKEFIRFYEEYAIAHNCHYLRIDTQEKNIAARKMYAKLNFEEAEIVDGKFFNGISSVRLVCLEKAL